MPVLDAYAVVALLTDEPAADAVATLLRGGQCRTTASGVAEVPDRMARLYEAVPGEVVADLATLGLFDAVPVDARLAADARATDGSIWSARA